MHPEQPQSPEGKPEFGPAEEEFYRMEEDGFKKERAHLQELAHVCSWIGQMLSRHPVGKEPGRHLEQSSTIGELIEFANRDTDDETVRHNYDEANRIASMVRKLKDAKFVPPEAVTVGELYDSLYDKMLTGEKQLKATKKEQR